MKTIKVAAPGSCGELVQGQIDGHDFHVSCPVDLFSRATIDTDSDPHEFVRLMPKAARAAASALRLSKETRPVPGLAIDSDLEPGKGMASSTADITAAAAAVTLATGRRPLETDLAELALSIEPTDGTIFSGIVAFDHRKGSRLSRLGPAPLLKISFIDTGGRVDTVEFNRTKKKYSPGQLRSLRRAYDLILAGLKLRDPHLIGMASTLSARINQEILPKPGFDELLEASRSVGGYGVVVAHSGTVAGVLHDRPDHDVCAALASIGLSAPRTVRLVSGGWRLCPS